MINALSGIMKKTAGVMLVAMMLVTCFDVGGNLFGHPVLGSEELVSLLAALLIAFSLPAAHQENAHIGVDLFYMKFPSATKRINDIILCLIRVLFFELMAWECFKYALDLKRIGQVSAILELPTYMILFAVAFGCVVLGIVIVVEMLTLIKMKPDAYHGRLPATLKSDSPKPKKCEVNPRDAHDGKDLHGASAATPMEKISQCGEEGALQNDETGRGK